MKYIVNAINITDNSIVESWQFESYEAAYEFAFNLNDLLQHTNLRYRVQN